MLEKIIERIKKTGWKRVARKTLKGVVYFHAGFIAVIFIFCVFYNFVNPAYSSLMFYRQLFYGARPLKTSFTPLSGMPAGLVRMVVDAEDNTFYSHWGIEPAAIKEALLKNRRAGYYRFGGSTITQQLARTLFLVPKKWLVRKYLEAIIAVELDLFVSKKRVMELYLNCIEWGPGIYGIGAASRYYFKKPPSELSEDEVLSLVSVIPSPLYYTPFNFRENRGLQERYNGLLYRFYGGVDTNSNSQASGQAGPDNSGVDTNGASATNSSAGTNRSGNDAADGE